MAPIGITHINMQNIKTITSNHRKQNQGKAYKHLSTHEACN